VVVGALVIALAGNQKFTIADGFRQLNPLTLPVPDLFNVWLKLSIGLKAFMEFAIQALSLMPETGWRQPRLNSSRPE
jgi:hypothetical protein